MSFAMLGGLPLIAYSIKAAQQSKLLTDIFVSTDDAEIAASRTAGGTDVVSHDDYADKTIVSLRDTLAFSPGVYTQPRFGQEVRISVRGSGQPARISYARADLIAGWHSHQSC